MLVRGSRRFNAQSASGLKILVSCPPFNIEAG
jgi:hypothetical protein